MKEEGQVKISIYPFNNGGILEGFCMLERDIEFLLKKYGSNYVKGEIHLAQTNKLYKRNRRLIEKHNICENLFEECNYFTFSEAEKNFIHYLINRFSNFKELHARANVETIILVFIFYVKKLNNPSVNLNHYSISKKYGLSDQVFKLVICRICVDFIKNSPIIEYETSKYNHELLSKNGGKI